MSVDVISTFHTDRDLPRAHFIILSDNEEFDVLKGQILELSSRPGTQGARFILSIEKRSEKVLRLAAACNFKDLIPDDLPPDTWIKRVAFAIEGISVRYQLPFGPIHFEQPARLYIPARVVAVNLESARVELAANPLIGRVVELIGPLAKVLSDTTLCMRVLRYRQQELYYRFKSSVDVTWLPSEDLKPLKPSFLSNFKPLWTLPKVLVVVADPKLRSSISELVRDGGIVSWALVLKNLPFECRYFSPDILIVEGKLLTQIDELILERMLAELPSSCEIVCFRSEGFTMPEVVDRSDFNVSLLDRSQVQAVKNHTSVLGASNQRDPMHHIPHDCAVSFAMATAEARLLRIHPTFLELAVPFKLELFSIFRIAAPIFKESIGRGVWLKCVEATRATVEDTTGYQVKAILIDLSVKERSQISEALAAKFQSLLQADVVKAPADQEKIVSYQGVSDVASDQVRRVLTHGFKKGYVNILVVAIIIAIGLFLIVNAGAIFSGFYERSGKVYVDQLIKFQKGKEK